MISSVLLSIHVISSHLISSYLFRRFRSPAKTAQFDQPPEREKRKERKKRKKQSEGRRLSAGRTTFVLYHEFRTFPLSDKSCDAIRAKIEMLFLFCFWTDLDKILYGALIRPENAIKPIGKGCDEFWAAALLGLMTCGTTALHRQSHIFAQRPIKIS